MATMARLFGSKNQEVQELEKEGAKAIATQSEEPIRYDLDEEALCVGEERIVLQPQALQQPAVKELMATLLCWINDSLEDRRIIVRDLTEDIYDGQVLGELLQQLTGETLNVIPVTQSAYMQKNKLKTLLEKVNSILNIPEGTVQWSVQSIHSKDIVATLHLLVALARHFRCKLPLTKNVKIKRIHLVQRENKLDSTLFEEEITGSDIGPTAPAPTVERDVFDKLFDQAPEKLDAVKRSLCQFASRVLQEMDIVINDLENQFSSGAYLVLMMGLLEGYFIPLYQLHLTPTTFDEKLDNVKLAFRLLEDAGLPQTRVKPDDLVHKNLKSTMRVLYAIFGKYKAAIQQQAAVRASTVPPAAPPAVQV